MMRFLQPPDWAPPKGYANGVLAEGRLLFVAGQIGWDAEQRLVADDVVGQTRQALANIAAVLEAGGARPEHVARMTWYVTDKQAYNRAQRAIGEAYRAVFGAHYPAMTLVEVADLLEPGALVEIEATAVVPRDQP
jgi:enamine deaminase RidA (YjgF/YER057c/UK114 family)